MGTIHKLIPVAFFIQIFSAFELHAEDEELRTSYYKVATTAANLIHDEGSDLTNTSESETTLAESTEPKSCDEVKAETSTAKIELEKRIHSDELIRATEEFMKLCEKDERCKPALIERISKMELPIDIKQQLLGWVIGSLFKGENQPKLTPDQTIKLGLSIASTAFYFSDLVCTWTAKLFPGVGKACKVALNWISDYFRMSATQTCAAS